MRSWLFLFFFLILLNLNASNIDKQLKEIQKNNPNLIIGKASADTAQEADKLALQDLTSQIIVKVESSFEDSAIENGQSVNEYCKRIVKTYSNVDLFSAKKLEEQVGNSFKVYRYITEKDKDNLFAQRKTQIINFLIEGEIALANYNIADFLRNYYWALMLLKSHPQEKTMTYYFGTSERLIHIAVPSEMERVLKDINIELINIISEKDANFSELVVEAKYKNKTVNGLLVSYHDGMSWTPASKWTNGLEYLNISKLALEKQKEILFKIDYTYANHSFAGPIDLSIENFPPINLLYADKKVKLSNKSLKNNKVKEDLFSFDKTIEEDNKMLIRDVITAINQKDLVSVRKHFTNQGFKEFNALLGYGNAVIIPRKSLLKQIQVADNKIIRSLPMKFKFPTSQEEFSERVNFILDNDNKISGISFALSQKACKDIIDKDFASDKEKAIIINFMEQYKTAYCLKDLDFIKNVFSNDALIIIGRVVKSQPDQVNDMLYGQLNKATVEYVKLNKKQYVERLSNQFNNKEFINIHFTENIVDKVMHDNKRIFGIQIAQYYYSSNYADQGYLFLMFDLNDLEHPKIMVRSWQPQKNEDGSIIGLEDFSWE